MIVMTKVTQDLLNFVIIPKIENAKSTPNRGDFILNQINTHTTG